MINFLRRNSPPKKVAAQIADLPVVITFKKVKTLRLTIRPPNADILISAPHGLSLPTIEHFVRERLNWIKGHREDILSRPKLPEPMFETGEKLFVWGEEVELRVIPTNGRGSVELKGKQLLLKAPAHSDIPTRAALVDRWLKKEVKREVPGYLAKWEPLMGVTTTRYSIRKMKTRWGSCTPSTRSIRLNSELARKSPECLEYVVVHELAHLIERSHNPRFKAVLDHHMPDWREIEGLLNPRRSPRRVL